MSTKLLDKVWEKVPEGLVLLNSKGLVLDVNPSFSGFLGQPANSIIGTSFHKLVDFPHRVSQKEIILSMISGTIVIGEENFQVAQGLREAQVIILKVGSGEILCVVLPKDSGFSDNLMVFQSGEWTPLPLGSLEMLPEYLTDLVNADIFFTDILEPSGFEVNGFPSEATTPSFAHRPNTGWNPFSNRPLSRAGTCPDIPPLDLDEDLFHDTHGFMREKSYLALGIEERRRWDRLFERLSSIERGQTKNETTQEQLLDEIKLTRKRLSGIEKFQGETESMNKRLLSEINQVRTQVNKHEDKLDHFRDRHEDQLGKHDDKISVNKALIWKIVGIGVGLSAAVTLGAVIAKLF